MKYKIKISNANVTQYYEVNQKFKLYYGVTFFFSGENHGVTLITYEVDFLPTIMHVTLLAKVGMYLTLI